MSNPATPLLCALLRGESPAWPPGAGSGDVDAFLREARYHGVTPLLDAQFRKSGSDPHSPRKLGSDLHSPGAEESRKGGSDPHFEDRWPDAIRRACRDDALVQAMNEFRRRTELVRVLAELAKAGIAPLILKGTALAYSHYADPVLRPRADTDLLVAPSDRDSSMRVLRALGYRRVSGPAGAHVGYQFEMTRIDPHGAAYSIDLHWRISNAQAFAWLFSFDELAAASVPVGALGPTARRLGDAHALLLALLHRAGNNLYVERDFGDRLVWLHDFRVLADAMSDDDRARFVRLACDRKVAAIAIQGLRRCADCLPSPRLAALIAELEKSPAARSGADLLGAGRLRREWIELRAIPTMRARLAYLAGRAIPDAEYMRERFPDARGRALPILHARRWLGGLAPRRSARER